MTTTTTAKTRPSKTTRLLDCLDDCQAVYQALPLTDPIARRALRRAAIIRRHLAR